MSVRDSYRVLFKVRANTVPVSLLNTRSTSGFGGTEGVGVRKPVRQMREGDMTSLWARSGIEPGCEVAVNS
jgi:hypothetical protein